MASQPKVGFLKKNYYRLKYWMLPPTQDKRKERFNQYQNLGIFVGSVLVVAYFEETISKFLEVDVDPSKFGTM